jgi:hypothetical protein
MNKGQSARRDIFRRELSAPLLENGRIQEDELRYVGRTKGFLIKPAELVYAGKFLSLGGKCMWEAILSFCRNGERVAWPGRERLGVMLGIKLRQVTVYLSELRAKNCLKSKRRPGTSSLYLLLDPPRSWMWQTNRELERLKEERKRRREMRPAAEIEKFIRENVRKTAQLNVRKTAQ